MDYNLLDLNTVLRSLGRGVVFYANRWLTGTPLALTHLGDTEGDIAVATNAEVAKLTTPELTGPAAQEADYTGEDPVIEIPLYLADPALLSVVSPIGSQHAGRSMRSSVVERTIVLFPESLFLTDGENGPEREQLSFAGGNWTLGGEALSADQLELLDGAVWLWRCYFNRPPRRFLGGAGDTRKNIETVSVQGMHHPDMPEGHHLYTTGDPGDYAIDITGGS